MQQLGLDGDRASVVAGLENLGEDEIGKDNRRLHERRTPAQLAPGEHIGAQRLVVTVPLDDGEGQQTDARGFGDGLGKLVACQLFLKDAVWHMPSNARQVL